MDAAEERAAPNRDSKPGVAPRSPLERNQPPQHGQMSSRRSKRRWRATNLDPAAHPATDGRSLDRDRFHTKRNRHPGAAKPPASAKPEPAVLSAHRLNGNDRWCLGREGMKWLGAERKGGRRKEGRHSPSSQSLSKTCGDEWRHQSNIHLIGDPLS